MKTFLFGILATMALGTQAFAAETLTDGVPVCKGVIQHNVGATAVPVKLTQFSANQIGAEIEGYSFLVNYSYASLLLTIRDSKKGVDYEGAGTLLNSAGKQELRIRLDDSLLKLTCGK